MFEYTTETLEGTTYYTTVNSRGTVTMMFELSGTVFVQVNSSPVKALEDIKKQSKQVKFLAEVMETKKAEEAEKETEKNDVEVGDLFIMGIGFGDSALCEVVKIENDIMNGCQAVLEMVEYGGPLHRMYISRLQELKNNKSEYYRGKA